jgi:hypothetical protein
MRELIKIIAFIQKTDYGLTRNIDENIFSSSLVKRRGLKKVVDTL